VKPNEALGRTAAALSVAGAPRLILRRILLAYGRRRPVSPSFDIRSLAKLLMNLRHEHGAVFLASRSREFLGCMNETEKLIAEINAFWEPAEIGRWIFRLRQLVEELHLLVRSHRVYLSFVRRCPSPAAR
jgi:hypothetical protein